MDLLGLAVDGASITEFWRGVLGIEIVSDGAGGFAPKFPTKTLG